MEVKWKVDITNPGACKSLAKELSATLPNFSLFLRENLLSENQNISANSIYDFFIPLLSVLQTELYSLETDLAMQKKEVIEYRSKLDLLQQQNIQNPRKHPGRPSVKFQVSESQAEHDIVLSNIKRWSKAATTIQKYWKGFKCRQAFHSKLQKIIIQVRPTGPRSLSNEQVMKSVLSEVEKRRLTLEQFYRAADKDCNGKVSFEELRSFMDDLKIVLPRSTVTRFMRIIDEDCSGYVTREEFFHALAAYNVSSEPLKDGSSESKPSRTYEEEMLLKFVKIMESREIEPENLFSLCDVDSSGSMSLKELENYLIKLKVGFQVKEVHALMKQLDTDGNGELSLEEFRRHFQKGHKFFKQEVISSTSAAPVTARNNDSSGLREFFKTLEFTGSLMNLLETIRSSQSSEVSVSTFYVMMEKNFNVKLNRNQVDLVQKVLVLNNRGMVSFDLFKPVAIFYTGKSLENRENYVVRVKMHLPKTKGEEKIFTRKEMAEELFFSPEQCMECIQFLAEPGEEFISSDFFYLEPSHDEEIKADKNEVLQLFNEKIKESGLDIRNIFRFADKSNSKMVSKDQLLTAFSKLVKGLTPKDLEDFEQTFEDESFDMETVMILFPPKRLDKNGLTIEAVHWLRYFSRTLRDARMSSLDFFNKLQKNSAGFASFREIKQKIKDLFEVIIKPGRVSKIGEFVFEDDSILLTSEKFVQLLLSCQSTDHSTAELKEYEKSMLSKNFDGEIQPLPPPQVAPVLPVPPKPSPKINPFSKPLISVELSSSLKKISQRVRENSWCGDLMKEYNLTLTHIISKEEDLFFITKHFEITKNENQEIYNELKKLNNHSVFHVFFFCTVVDLVTHSLNQLPFAWNKQIDGTMALLIVGYIKKSGIRNIYLTDAHKDLQRKADFTTFIDYFQDPEKIAGFFHPNSPLYHFIAVVGSYIEEKSFSIANIMRSKFIFDYETIRNRDDPSIKKENLEKIFSSEDDWKREWVEKKFFNEEQARQVFLFLYPNFKTIYPGYIFQYFLDIIERNLRSEEIKFDPFNNELVDPETRSFFLGLCSKLRYPLTHYISGITLGGNISTTVLKTELRKIFNSPEVVRLELIDKSNILVYHLLAVLDSYRSFPCNYIFDYSKIFRIFNDPRRRAVVEEQIKNISKEKIFEDDTLAKIKEKVIKITKEAKDIPNKDRMTEDQVLKELRKSQEREEEEFEDFGYFIDPNHKGKSFYGFQLVFLHEICFSSDLFQRTPMMLNRNNDQNTVKIFSDLASLLKTNQISTIEISNIHLEKELSISDLASIKLFTNHRTRFNSILESLPAKGKYYQFLAVLESYRDESYNSGKNNSTFPENFLRLIDRNKKLVEIFKNPPLDKLYDFNEFKQLFESCFQGISQGIIERLFQKIDKRSFNKIFMYEIMTAIDIMQQFSINKKKVSFIYRDEFQAMTENAVQFEDVYSKKREAHIRYQEMAEFFDDKLVPTLRKRTLLNMRGSNGESFTGYEKLQLQELTNYLFRITNCNYYLKPLFDNLKIDDSVTFYHFFAVFESYRKRVIIDKFHQDIDVNKAINIAPIERNPNQIRLPADTRVLEPGSYEHELYQIKTKVKADYKAIYAQFKQAAPDGSFSYESFKRILREAVVPRVTEQNLNLLIRNIDRDKNKVISLEEFFSYVFETPFEESVKEEKKVRDLKTLEENDFFDPGLKKYSTILNSEEAAIIRCKQLLETIEKNKPFNDPDFGPHQGRNGDECLYWNKEPPSSSYPNPYSQEFQWKSAGDVFEDPNFIKQGTESGDVIQGSLGDCWFIGALSVMALRDDLLYGNLEDVKSSEEINVENGRMMSKGVYSGIFHNLKDVGMYVFKFFINNAWRWVIVDDKLPMYVDPDSAHCEFVFGHCKDKSELWVALIEKAYAKVFGCYEALNGGLIDDALTDLTGLVAEKCKISGQGGVLDLNNVDVQATQALWNKLVKYRQDRTLMGCSIDGDGVEGEVVFEGEKTGLLSRHAYSIIDVLTLDDPKAPKGRHRLLRIRNPWGQREWMGKWRDHSQELENFRDQINQKTAELGEEEKFNEIDPNDGTFFMCFKDWRRIFSNLYACVDFSREWSGKRFSGQWTVENSGGVPLSEKNEECVRWAKNPQFCMELKKEAEVFISLSQKDGRYVKNSKFPFDDIINTCCFAIMRGEQSEVLLNRFAREKIEKVSVLKAHRNVEMRTVLKAGKYFIVPATSAPGKTGDFWLSIYFNSLKQDINIYNCRNTNDVGEFIKEEEEDEENLTESDLQELRRRFNSLRHKT